MWDRVRRCALRISVVYLCLSVLAVGVVWWIEREGPPSAVLPSQPSGGGSLSVRQHGDLARSDQSVARVPADERHRRTTGDEDLVRPQPTDDRHGRPPPPAVSADRLRGGRPLPFPSETPSSRDRDRPARPGTATRRPIGGLNPPTTGGPSTTTTGTTTPTTTPSTGTTTPTTTPTTTGTTGPAPSMERRSLR